MTATELDAIERELGIRLPADYRDVMLSYAFQPDSSLSSYALPNHVAHILEMNRAMRADPWSPNWKREYFVIGGDGGECHFFLDSSCERSPVFEISIEDGGIAEHSANLSAFIGECQKVDAEVDAKMAQKANRTRKR
jgi:hypothetical protein